VVGESSGPKFRDARGDVGTTLSNELLALLSLIFRGFSLSSDNGCTLSKNRSCKIIEIWEQNLNLV